MRMFWTASIFRMGCRMMHRSRQTVFWLVLTICSGVSVFSVVQAQEEVYRLEQVGIFGTLRRPAVDFPHAAHVAALSQKGCGVCHHGPDYLTGKLTYIPNEEKGCSACHGTVEQDDAPALREAYHGLCTGCHRRLAKAATVPRGPTTCGECHRPPSR